MLRRHLLFVVTLSILTAWTRSESKEFPVVDPAEISAKYGKPDKISSSEFEKPRPPMVMKTLEYRKERVNVVFLANAPMGSPPPYKSWKLLGYQDADTKRAMSAGEAQKRLASRKKS